jgi:hypothetical protein
MFDALSIAKAAVLVALGFALGYWWVDSDRDAAHAGLAAVQMQGKDRELDASREQVTAGEAARGEEAARVDIVNGGRNELDAANKEIGLLRRRLTDTQRLLDDARRAATGVANRVGADAAAACDARLAAFSDALGEMDRTGAEISEFATKCDFERWVLSSKWEELYRRDQAQHASQ